MERRGRKYNLRCVEDSFESEFMRFTTTVYANRFRPLINAGGAQYDSGQRK